MGDSLFTIQGQCFVLVGLEVFLLPVSKRDKDGKGVYNAREKV